MRRLDERQMLEEKKANLVGIPMQNPFFTEEQQALRWSHFKQQDPEKMFDLFTKGIELSTAGDSRERLTVFDHMKSLGAHAGVFAQYMKGATFMIPTPRLLDQVVQMIDKIQMDDRDTKGDLYEYLLSKIASAGTNGQFRTPRHIIKMMVDMVEPKINDTICDPSCGTAGFLVAAGEYVHEKQPDWFHDKAFREHYNSEMFTGVEFDSTMLRIAAMNLTLHGIESPTLIGKDALSESNADEREKYSLILANPPFKGSLDYDSVESSLLKTVKTKKTELIFLGLMLRMLKTGGRCAVIVPDGVLFGSSTAHKQIRREIIEQHKLDAVIKMPSGVFKPYAGVSTAILFFTKTGSGGTDKVWFYDMQADGFSLDDKRSPVAENDIPDILERWKKHSAIQRAAISATKTSMANSPSHSELTWESHPELVSGSDANSQEIPKQVRDDNKKGDSTSTLNDRTQKSFLVPFKEIEANDWDLSINRYKEVVYEEVEYAAPADIIADIKQLDIERAEALRALEELLG
jgi:type I restriction enzyme M protein